MQIEAAIHLDTVKRRKQKMFVSTWIINKNFQKIAHFIERQTLDAKIEFKKSVCMLSE